MKLLVVNYTRIFAFCCIGFCFITPLKAEPNDPIVFATDWRAQAEHGGFYQAKALGLYEKAGLNVRILQGGPGVNIPQLLAAGRIDFGMGSNSFVPLNMVAAKVPAKAVMAAFQKDPQVLITHPRDDVNSIADMKNNPIMVADATISTFWIWLRAEFGFANKQIRKYTYNLAPFLVNPKAIQQGYLTSEPYLIEKEAGIKPEVYLLSDEGYSSYAAMVLTSHKMIEENPDVVRRFVAASIAGWESYIYGNPIAGNQLILRENPDMKQDVLDQAILKIRHHNLVRKPEEDSTAIGKMNAARWQKFFNIMSSNGVYDLSIDWTSAFTTDFIPSSTTE